MVSPRAQPGLDGRRVAEQLLNPALVEVARRSLRLVDVHEVRRIANRAVLLRQNALLLIVKQIEEKGGKFTPGGPGKPGAEVNSGAILAALAALAFLRF